jgi:hypothetical protein
LPATPGAQSFFSESDPVDPAASGDGLGPRAPRLGTRKILWRGKTWRIASKEADGLSVLLYLQQTH